MPSNYCDAPLPGNPEITCELQHGHWAMGKWLHGANWSAELERWADTWPVHEGDHVRDHALNTRE